MFRAIAEIVPAHHPRIQTNVKRFVCPEYPLEYPLQRHYGSGFNSKRLLANSGRGMPRPYESRTVFCSRSIMFRCILRFTRAHRIAGMASRGFSRVSMP